MAFHIWDGQKTECRTFMDLYQWMHKHPEEILCPACGGKMKFGVLFLNYLGKMNKIQALCETPKCRFYLDPIVFQQTTKGGN